MSRGKARDKLPDKLDKIDQNLEKIITKLRQRRVNIEVMPSIDHKAIKQWSKRCIKPLRNFCEKVLAELFTNYTPVSVNNLLNEVASRGLRLEIALALASQYDPVYLNDAYLRRYIEEGFVDWDYLVSVLANYGFRFGVDELKNLLTQTETKRRFGLPRSLGFKGLKK
jgi:tyrosine-protein phosphatase YwqE